MSGASVPDDNEYERAEVELAAAMIRVISREATLGLWPMLVAVLLIVATSPLVVVGIRHIEPGWLQGIVIGWCVVSGVLALFEMVRERRARELSVDEHLEQIRAKVTALGQEPWWRLPRQTWLLWARTDVPWALVAGFGATILWPLAFGVLVAAVLIVWPLAARFLSRRDRRIRRVLGFALARGPLQTPEI